MTPNFRKVCLFCLGALLIVQQLPGQTVQTQHGKIIRHENFPSTFIQPRHVDVWLPADYTPQKKYAVLYMHDGQMLFDSTTTWNKQEWGVDETLSRLMAENKIRDCIVVGIWNGGSLRHTEYFPQKPFEALSTADIAVLREALKDAGRAEANDFTPRSDQYLKFMVQELKPFIDKTYSTRKGPKNTFIAGSSMGGLISMYALCEYPGVFGGAACLSTHWPGIFRVENNPAPAALLQYLEQKLPKPKRNRLYFDYGTATLDALYAPFQARADAIMREKGYSAPLWKTLVFEGDDHSERAWSRRLELPLVFLLGR